MLDLRMPVLDGVAAIGEIRKEDASARVVILTTYDSDNNIYRAIAAGANGYLYWSLGNEAGELSSVRTKLSASGAW